MKNIYLNNLDLEEMNQIEMQKMGGGNAPSWLGILGIFDAINDFYDGFRDGFSKKPLSK